eukprot:m.90111 g.90111  ORF g.90111 m.90111 type:complete len:1117 (+) comp12905_c0_seq14:191-3541(+)
MAYFMREVQLLQFAKVPVIVQGVRDIARADMTWVLDTIGNYKPSDGPPNSGFHYVESIRDAMANPGLVAFISLQSATSALPDQHIHAVATDNSNTMFKFTIVRLILGDSQRKSTPAGTFHIGTRGDSRGMLEQVLDKLYHVILRNIAAVTAASPSPRTSSDKGATTADAQMHYHKGLLSLVQGQFSVAEQSLAHAAALYSHWNEHTAHAYAVEAHAAAQVCQNGGNLSLVDALSVSQQLVGAAEELKATGTLSLATCTSPRLFFMCYRALHLLEQHATASEARRAMLPFISLILSMVSLEIDAVAGMVRSNTAMSSIDKFCGHIKRIATRTAAFCSTHRFSHKRAMATWLKCEAIKYSSGDRSDVSMLDASVISARMANVTPGTDYLKALVQHASAIGLPITWHSSSRRSTRRPQAMDHIEQWEASPLHPLQLDALTKLLTAAKQLHHISTIAQLFSLLSKVNEPKDAIEVLSTNAVAALVTAAPTSTPFDLRDLLYCTLSMRTQTEAFQPRLRDPARIFVFDAASKKKNTPKDMHVCVGDRIECDVSLHNPWPLEVVLQSCHVVFEGTDSHLSYSEPVAIPPNTTKSIVCSGKLFEEGVFRLSKLQMHVNTLQYRVSLRYQQHQATSPPSSTSLSTTAAIGREPQPSRATTGTINITTVKAFPPFCKLDMHVPGSSPSPAAATGTFDNQQESDTCHPVHSFSYRPRIVSLLLANTCPFTASTISITPRSTAKKHMLHLLDKTTGPLRPGEVFAFHVPICEELEDSVTSMTIKVEYKPDPRDVIDSARATASVGDGDRDTATSALAETRSAKNGETTSTPFVQESQSAPSLFFNPENLYRQQVVHLIFPPKPASFCFQAEHLSTCTCSSVPSKSPNVAAVSSSPECHLHLAIRNASDYPAAISLVPDLHLSIPPQQTIDLHLSDSQTAVLRKALGSPPVTQQALQAAVESLGVGDAQTLSASSLECHPDVVSTLVPPFQCTATLIHPLECADGLVQLNLTIIAATPLNFLHVVSVTGLPIRASGRCQFPLSPSLVTHTEPFYFTSDGVTDESCIGDERQHQQQAQHGFHLQGQLHTQTKHHTSIGALGVMICEAASNTTGGTHDVVFQATVPIHQE